MNEHSARGGVNRLRWLGALAGVFAFVTGLQREYVLVPVTDWLREWPAWLLVPVVALITGFVLSTIRRRITRRAARIGVLSAQIDQALRP